MSTIRKIQNKKSVKTHKKRDTEIGEEIVDDEVAPTDQVVQITEDKRDGENNDNQKNENNLDENIININNQEHDEHVENKDFNKIEINEHHDGHDEEKKKLIKDEIHKKFAEDCPKENKKDENFHGVTHNNTNSESSPPCWVHCTLPWLFLIIVISLGIYALKNKIK